uniref:Uncharacterized protein n=1 Tax=Heterorhabditis bacteriophora TaxID=37862 RepID=A0A1I7W9Y8_HETBA
MECTTLRTALCRLINSFVIQSTSYSQFEISLEHLEYLRYSLHNSRENEYSRLVLLKVNYKNNFPLKMARFSTIYLYIFKVARLFGVMFQFVSKNFLANTPVTNEFSLFQYLNRIPHIFSVIIIFAMLLNLFPLNTSIIVFFMKKCRLL